MEPRMQLPSFELLQAVTGWLVRAKAHTRARHQALQLKTMSERELRDLGIGSSEIPALLNAVEDERRES